MTGHRSRSRGFTLLEVLVAIAILGIGLTVILGSQVGLFTNAARGEHLTIATNLARCKMGELEVDLLKLGYQLTDVIDDGPCCGDDEGNDGYHCSWKIERVTLPELPLNNLDAGAPGAGDAGLDLGPIGLLAGLSPPGGGQSLGQSLGDKATPTDLASSLSKAPSAGGLAPMMMTMVYPTLKPMLEASIRKVTVTVTYKEGKFERELAVTQYVTNPQQGQLDPSVAGTGGGGPGAGLNSLFGGTTTGSPSPGGGLLPGFPGLVPK
jgi:general secretion pathway protein I